MTETIAEPTGSHPWLPLSLVLSWLQVDADGPAAGVVDQVRAAAAAHCERQRSDLFDLVDGDYVGPAGQLDVIRQAGLLAAARLYARRGSPAGLASFGEFGASEVLRRDPDVAALLGTGRHAHPKVG